MKHNRIITISEHAVDRFIERFQFAGAKMESVSAVRAAAERAIVTIWETASYVSDDPEGILFRNRDYNCDFIVSNRMIKTLFPTRPNAGQPENHSATDLRLKAEHNSRFKKQSSRPQRSGR